jgi:hypothetical protein
LPSAAAIAQACLILGTVIVHVIGFGILLTRAAQFEEKDSCTIIATVGGAGLTALGFYLLLLGYFSAWNDITWCISSSAFFLLSIRLLSSHKWAAISTFQVLEWRKNTKLDLVFMTFAVATVCVSLVSCLRPTVMSDESDYHWPAPVLWASVHHWSPSPYRFMNGPALIELLYIPGALFNNLTAAHATHFLTWLVLIASCCALGRLLKSATLPVLVAVMACPVITVQSSTAMNDLGTTALVLSSVAILFARSCKTNLKQIALSSFVLCGALSSKPPVALAVVPIMLAYVVFGFENNTAKERIRRVAVFFLPLILIGICWLTHTYSLIGKLVDIPIDAIWSHGNHSTDAVLSYSGSNLGMASPPSINKVLVLILTPFVTCILGNQEPWGNRTGFVIPLFFPLFLIALKRFGKELKSLGWWLVALSGSYFIGVGLFVIRTRYNMVVWAIWSALAGVGFYYFYESLGGKKKWALALVFTLLVGVGCIDSCRTLLMWDAHPKHHIMPKILWFLGK